ncbi:MAG: OmpA family protein [Saprospiraceae bacterium]|nr:OmpA family protein [Saprospiraceae bacterium]
MEASISQEKDIKCAGETTSLKVEINGGKAPFSITWSNGNKSESASSLNAGSYSVTVSDATGKSVTATKQVTEPKPVKAVVSKIKPAVSDKVSNGRATVDATGGSGTFTYKWDNNETTAGAVSLPAGQRTVTVTDANGCTATASFEVKTRIIPELSANNLRSGETIKLEKIYFQPDSTRMEETSRPTLDELYEFLQENTAITIEVGGHTNGIPPHDFCDKLSTERAKSVAQYLVDKGLPANRITYKGYGKRNPVANNATPEGRAKNQRVEIKIVKTS